MSGPSKFSIRNATPKEIPLIRELTFQVWPQTYRGLLTQEQIDYMLEMMYSESSLENQMTKQHCRFIIVYEEEEPVGFASYSEIEPRVFKLHKIYVLPSQQGKGTGRFVIDYIIEDIRSKNAISLQLQVNRNNKARSFYEKLGFSVADEIRLDIGGGFYMDDYVMQKSI